MPEVDKLMMKGYVVASKPTGQGFFFSNINPSQNTRAVRPLLLKNEKDNVWLCWLVCLFVSTQMSTLANVVRPAVMLI